MQHLDKGMCPVKYDCLKENGKVTNLKQSSTEMVRRYTPTSVSIVPQKSPPPPALSTQYKSKTVKKPGIHIG